jgi:hypothetical protein
MAKRGYQTVPLPVKTESKPVPVRMSPRRAETARKIIGEMSTFDGIKILDLMEAVYVQGLKDGARAAFDQVDRSVTQAKKAIPHRAPGRPRKRT